MAVTDLVLEGGGAKLPGLVGAVNALTSADYSIHRIAETSAGAIVGALTTAGIPPESLIETVLGKDFTDFEDLNPASGLVPWLGKIQGLLFHKGMYLGTALHDFLDDILTSQGIRTWGDLRLDDPDSALPRSGSTGSSSSSPTSPAAECCDCPGITNRLSVSTRILSRSPRRSAPLPRRRSSSGPDHCQRIRVWPAVTRCSVPTAVCCRTSPSASSTAKMRSLPAGRLWA